MNRNELSGRLVRDPQININQEDKAKSVARFTLAVRRRGRGTEPDYIPVVAFGYWAEFTEKYLRQGSKIIVGGHLHSGSYEKDGNKVYTLAVVADEIEFAESKKEAAESTPAPEFDPTEGFMNIPDGIDQEVPFE